MKKNQYINWELNNSKLYHKYYWQKSLKNWIPRSSLIKDTFDQVSYPIEAGIFDIAKETIFEILDAYSQVVPYDTKKYENVMDSILNTAKDSSCIVLFNHDNFATMSIFIRELYKHANKINKDESNKNIDLKQNLHTIVWPTITTQAQVRSLKAISNILKTVPSRDDIPGMETSLKSIKSSFIKQLITTTKLPNQIILMAPTGTRDVLYRNSDGTINSILFQNDDGITNTARMVKSLAESWTRVILVGTNWVWLKRPGAKHLKETDNNRTPADVYIDVQELSPEESLSLIEEKKLMSTIAWLVRDHKGNPIAKAIDPIEFDIYKWLPQQIDIEKDKYKNYYFKDSLHKRIVRKLYTLLR